MRICITRNPSSLNQFYFLSNFNVASSIFGHDLIIISKKPFCEYRLIYFRSSIPNVKKNLHLFLPTGVLNITFLLL